MAIQHAAALSKPIPAQPFVLGDIDDFHECCQHHRMFVDMGIITPTVAAKSLQWLAQLWELVDYTADGDLELDGERRHRRPTEQDLIQAMIADAISARFDQPEPSPPLGPEPEPPRAYRTPQATIDAFWHIVRNEKPEYLADWLADHPRDKAHLHTIWERKCLSAAK
jgi:hypothetical protein